MISKRQIVGLVFAVSAIAYAGFYPTQSIAEAPPLVPLSQRADFVEVSKGNREMRLLRKGKVIRRYQIALGFAPKGDKQREGDGKTPEGLYLLDFRNPNSSFHLSLHINYPSPKDKAEADARGEPPGGDIFIHGGPRGVPDFLWRGKDWTLGCISVTNDDIEEIWSLVPDATPILIEP